MAAATLPDCAKQRARNTPPWPGRPGQRVRLAASTEGAPLTISRYAVLSVSSFSANAFSWAAAEAIVS